MLLLLPRLPFIVILEAALLVHAPTVPNSIGLTTVIEYNVTVTSEKQGQLQEDIEDNMKGTGCTAVNQCNVTASMSTESRRKRSAGTTVNVNFIFEISATGELGLDLFLENETVTQNFQVMTGTIKLMESIAEQLETEPNDLFDVEIDGVLYTVDPASLSISGAANCPDGYSSVDGACVACPAGTRHLDRLCTFCDIGTYQDEPAQSACKSCPAGFTTAAIGANSLTKCSVAVPVTTPTTTNTARSDNSWSGGTTSTLTVIAGCVGGFAVLLLLIGGALFVWKKVGKTFAREDKPGSIGNLNMVRPGRSTHVVQPQKTSFRPYRGASLVNDVGMETNSLAPGYTNPGLHNPRVTPPPVYTSHVDIPAKV